MSANTLNRILDIANLLPFPPRQIMAYPLDMIARLFGEEPVTFLVPNDDETPLSGLQIQMLLLAHGVRMWGGFVMMPPINDIMFTVKKSQARFAAYLLRKAGIEVQGG